MKRHDEEDFQGQEDGKRIKTENGLDALASVSTANSMSMSMATSSRAPVTKARENRLEQNRKAARESRRRKKLMIEELQRSVIFFSKANGTLKMQNEELGRRFMEAQARVAAIEANKGSDCPAQPEIPLKQVETRAPPSLNEQVQAQAVATQALYESQGFPAGAARAAAQAINASTPGPDQTQSNTPSVNGVPQMQPGATMQAMAAFQQAAAAAMQAAMGMNPAASPQQAYADAINAFAQQAGQAQFAQGIQFIGFPPAIPMAMMWQQPPKQCVEIPQQVSQQPEQPSM